MDRECIVTDSTNVYKVSYDVKNRRLRITFGNGDYEYQDVQADMFGALVSAQSVGSAVNNWIRNAAPKGNKV